MTTSGFKYYVVYIMILLHGKYTVNYKNVKLSCILFNYPLQ